MYNRVARYWKTGIAEQMLCKNFVHRARAGMNGAANVRKTENLKQSLECSVFTRRAMEHWEYNVHSVFPKRLIDLGIKLEKNNIGIRAPKRISNSSTGHARHFRFCGGSTTHHSD